MDADDGARLRALVGPTIEKKGLPAACSVAPWRPERQVDPGWNAVAVAVLEDALPERERRLPDQVERGSEVHPDDVKVCSLALDVLACR